MLLFAGCADSCEEAVKLMQDSIDLSLIHILPYDNDILVALHVAKKPIRIAYLSQRNTATDFPVVACAVSEYDLSLIHILYMRQVPHVFLSHAVLSWHR